MEIQRIKIQLPMPIHSYNIYVGVDPGTVNLGLAIINGYLTNPQGELFQIKIERDKNPVLRVETAWVLMTEIIGNTLPYYSGAMKAVVEGAAYMASRYRQVELAEIRASIVLWLVAHRFKVEIVPPNTLRKAVFGSAKILPHEAWKDLNLPKDAAQALACAYYADRF